jgi:hypothetical protein
LGVERDVEPRNTSFDCKHLSIPTNVQFHVLDPVHPESCAAKMSHRPTKVSFHVEGRILLTTVAGRSSMDRMVEGIEHMVIESVLFIAFVAMIGAAIVKAYEWRQDVLYGPYMKRGD